MWKIDLVKDRDKKSFSATSPTADSSGMCFLCVLLTYILTCLYDTL